jgi:hypothetical protein
MEDVFVVDTSVIIKDPDVFFNLGRKWIIVSTAAIKELGGLKWSTDSKKAGAAKRASRTRDDLGLLSAFSNLADSDMHNCAFESEPGRQDSSQRPPTLSVACNGKTTDKVLRLALKCGSLFIGLTDIVGSLKVWCLRPHAPPLTLSVVLSH